MDDTSCTSPAMSPDLIKQADLLCNEVGELQYRYQEFENLFGFSKARVEMLNEVAPVFFNMIAQVLWGDILMHLTRVTGPSQTHVGKNIYENLSIQRLPDLVDDVEIRATVQAAVNQAIAAAKFAGNGRNKFYAHQDLNVALDSDSMGITLGSRQNMRSAIEATMFVFDVLAHSYKRPSIYVHDHGWGLAEDLVKVIEVGLKACQKNSF